MSTAKPEGTSKTLVRTVVGAIYFVVLVGCLYAGTAVTAIAVSIMGGMCAWELLRMFKGAGREPNEIIALVATLVYPLMPLTRLTDGALFISVVLLAAIAVWYVLTPRTTITDVALTLFVPIYCGFAFSAVTMIRASDPGMQGFLLTFGVMGSIWLNDAMAYFVGTRFGSRKLAPRISPNKSVEGFIGGLVGCLFIWLLLWLLHVHTIKLLFALPTGLIVGVAGVLGDLFESRIKRGFGVKDSGNLLPGHGGMLDRSDALLFGCMMAFLLLSLEGIV